MGRGDYVIGVDECPAAKRLLDAAAGGDSAAHNSGHPGVLVRRGVQTGNDLAAAI
jgi:hypothetical protein